MHGIYVYRETRNADDRGEKARGRVGAKSPIRNTMHLHLLDIWIWLLRYSCEIIGYNKPDRTTFIGPLRRNLAGCAVSGEVE